MIREFARFVAVPLSLGGSAMVLPLLLSATLLGTPAFAAEASGKTFVYIVAKGDTVQSVCKQYLDKPSNFAEVAKASGLHNANRIYPGNKLSIPVALLRGTATPLSISAISGGVTVDGKDATVDMPVTEGAKVETADGASAVLLREDGTKLTILPNSVAEISKNRSIDKETNLLRSAIRLVGGAMDFVVQKIGLKDHVVVNTPTSTIGVRGTQYRVVAKTKSSKVEVLEGTVATDGAKATGKHLALNGGFGTIVPKGGPPLGAIALLPAPKLNDFDAGKTLELATNTITITSVPGAVAYSYVVSPEGTPEVRTQAGRSDKPSIILPRLPDAKYQLAVRAIDKNELEGFDTLVPFSVKVSDKPNALSAQSQSIDMLLSWQGSLNSMLYRVQLARDADFKDLVTEGVVNEPKALLKDVEPGKYFLRVGVPKDKAVTDASKVKEWEYSINYPLEK